MFWNENHENVKKLKGLTVLSNFCVSSQYLSRSTLNKNKNMRKNFVLGFTTYAKLQKKKNFVKLFWGKM